MSQPEQSSEGRLATLGEAAALGFVLALVMAVPTLVRALGTVPLLDGFLAAFAVTASLALPVALLAPRAARGFRGVVGPSLPRALTAGVALWVALTAVGLVLLAALLRATTHHRGLGGATFGVFGAALICAAAVFAARAVGLGSALLDRGWPRGVMAALVGLAITLAAGALLMPLVLGEAHPASAALFDLLLALVAAGLLLPRRVPSALARPARLFALPLSLSLLVAGWYHVEKVPAAASIQEIRGLPGTILWALEAWTDQDGDGQGAHFGGYDCDEGDPHRHPGAEDADADGLDSDCDGRDLARSAPIQAEPRIAAAALPDPPEGAETVAAKAPAKKTKRPDIILVTLDTTRADRTSLYGYGRDTTPHLKKLAERAIVFEHAYATGSDTQRALTPLVSGRPLSRTPSSNIEWPRLRDETHTVAERLKAAGYRTGAVTGFTWLRKGRGFEQGFEHFDESPWRNAHPEREITGQAAAETSVAMYQKLTQGDGPLFLWLHLFDPHTDYHRHADFDFGKALQDRYDSEIAFTDAQLGKLLAAVQAGPRSGETLWLVHGSHGEAFGEHDKFEHGSDVYEEMIRVPMLLALPGGDGRRYGDRAVSVLDVAPTLLDFADADDSKVEGVSLRPLAAGGKLSRPPVLSFADRRTAVIDWPLKLRVFRRDDDSDRLLLFDLLEDPKETKDLSADRPEALRRLNQLR